MTKPSTSTTSRSGAVYRTLRRAIIEQALVPGTKLPEDAIGERLGVSRTLVREALLRLNGEGLVDLRPNRGACVAQPSLEEGQAIFAVRQALEQLVCETLAGRLTPKQLKDLEHHVDQEERTSGHDPIASIRLAGEFHTILAQMTGNAMLVRYVNEVVSRCSLTLALYGRPHSSDCAVSEHRQLIAALASGDAETAATLMKDHLAAIASRALIVVDRDIRDIIAKFAETEGLS